MREFRYIPENCEHPVCSHDGSPQLCVCHPVPKPVLMSIEEGILYLFTIEYLLRVCMVHAIPMA